MKTKIEKRNQARKQAEAIKANRKANRQVKGNAIMDATPSKKGKSLIPQSKSRAQKR